MICPQCQKEGKKSIIYPGMGYTTLVWNPPFYDENGKYHHHDTNATTSEYKCSNGHAWTEVTYPSCWCGWGREK